MKKIENSVAAPKGFLASGGYCGLGKNEKKGDLALIFSEVPATAAGVYTQNKVCGAPVTVTRNHLANGTAQAVICNSGNANTCNADGIEKAIATCKALGAELSISPEDVIVASTGVIGQPINAEKIIKKIPDMAKTLSKKGATDAAGAILTTDPFKKEAAYEIELSGKSVILGAMAKGSGMIEPNMATMLCFATTDANISPRMLKAALSFAVSRSFNKISVDGDTSTNDMVTILANGMAENKKIEAQNEDFEIFKLALTELLTELAKLVAKGGEGATKLLECHIKNAKTEKDAVVLGKSVINSPLVKTAFFGEDANWGRILCALGYAGVDFEPSRTDVYLSSKAGKIAVFKAGAGENIDEGLAKKILSENEIFIDVDLKDGNEDATVWGCDLSYDYVKINGDYRT